jgi:hypothetical protein
MAVMTLLDMIKNGVWEMVDDKKSPECYLCGKGFTAEEKFIVWAGNGDLLFLHSNCVPSFCRRILEDWDSIRLSNNGYQKKPLK